MMNKVQNLVIPKEQHVYGIFIPSGPSDPRHTVFYTSKSTSRKRYQVKPKRQLLKITDLPRNLKIQGSNPESAILRYPHGVSQVLQVNSEAVA
jgi:hypothetical protein